jgi:hypothetical protein
LVFPRPGADYVAPGKKQLSQKFERTSLISNARNWQHCRQHRFRNETEIDDEISLKGSFIHWRNN